jgi:hypothetical protein
VLPDEPLELPLEVWLEVPLLEPDEVLGELETTGGEDTVAGLLDDELDELLVTGELLWPDELVLAVTAGLDFGFGAAFIPGTAAAGARAVTAADWLVADDDGASEPEGVTVVVVDLVAIPMAKATANGIRAARASSHHRGRAAPSAGAIPPIWPCVAALLSIDCPSQKLVFRS